MQIGIVYTGVTPQLTECVERELTAVLGDAALRSYSNPEVLASIRETGGLNPQAVEQLLAMYWQAARDGAQVIYNACSSVGDAAHLAKPLFARLGLTVVQIDEEMAMEAVRRAERIAVIATLRTTLEPTCRLIRRCAELQGKAVQIAEAVVEVFGLAPEPFAEALCEAGRGLAPQADLILLAQGSMAWCQDKISEAAGLPVLSSPHYGAVGIKKALNTD